MQSPIMKNQHNFGDKFNMPNQMVNKVRSYDTKTTDPTYRDNNLERAAYLSTHLSD